MDFSSVLILSQNTLLLFDKPHPLSDSDNEQSEKHPPPNKKLLEIKFDLIFFTGSVNVGKIVMSQAAKHLTPVILELGGKSPCIVDETANISLAAKRIIWGKGINAGQTCVAPDYILVHKSVKDQLLTSLRMNIIAMYGDVSKPNEEYPKIINETNYNRINELIDSGEVYYGAKNNPNTNQISLTILDNVKWEDKIMEEEKYLNLKSVILQKQALNLIIRRF